MTDENKISHAVVLAMLAAMRYDVEGASKAIDAMGSWEVAELVKALDQLLDICEHVRRDRSRSS